MENKKFQRKKYLQWAINNKPAPPPDCVKQSVILEYAKKYNIETLIETGTFKGDMIEATKHYFKNIFSIELSEKLYELAKLRFRNDNNVQLIWGDSGEKICDVLKELQQPAIFWLDGHYSAGNTAQGDKTTPIVEELNKIFNYRHIHHIIIIDDVRLFGVEADYPSIEELCEFIHTHNDIYTIELKDDSMRLIPKTYLSQK